VGFDQYWDYGEEHNTASANYRPRDSNTALRKPRQRIAQAMAQAPTAEQAHEESPSFYRNEEASKQGPLAGALDFSGSSDNNKEADCEAEIMGNDRTQKSLEKEFDRLADSKPAS